MTLQAWFGQRRRWTRGLAEVLLDLALLVVMTTLLALPAQAQKFSDWSAPVNLDPTINLAVPHIHLASLGSNNLPFNPQTKHGQPHAQRKSVPCGRGLRQQPLAGPDSAGLTNAALRMTLVGTSPFARREGPSTPLMVGRFEVAHVSPAESERMQRFPALYQEDTPFSTQVRMPIADLWGGHLLIDGFYLQISANTVFRGLPQSSDLWWAAPASLSLRSIRSYGINLSLRLRVARRRTLHRYLFGEGA